MNKLFYFYFIVILTVICRAKKDHLVQSKIALHVQSLNNDFGAVPSALKPIISRNSQIHFAGKKDIPISSSPGKVSSPALSHPAPLEYNYFRKANSKQEDFRTFQPSSSFTKQLNPLPLSLPIKQAVNHSISIKTQYTSEPHSNERKIPITSYFTAIPLLSYRNDEEKIKPRYYYLNLTNLSQVHHSSTARLARVRRSANINSSDAINKKSGEICLPCLVQQFAATKKTTTTTTKPKENLYNTSPQQNSNYPTSTIRQTKPQVLKTTTLPTTRSVSKTSSQQQSPSSHSPKPLCSTTAVPTSLHHASMALPPQGCSEEKTHPSHVKCPTVTRLPQSHKFGSHSTKCCPKKQSEQHTTSLYAQKKKKQQKKPCIAQESSCDSHSIPCNPIVKTEHKPSKIIGKQSNFILPRIYRILKQSFSPEVIFGSKTIKADTSSGINKKSDFPDSKNIDTFFTLPVLGRLGKLGYPENGPKIIGTSSSDKSRKVHNGVHKDEHESMISLADSDESLEYFIPCTEAENGAKNCCKKCNAAKSSCSSMNLRCLACHSNEPGHSIRHSADKNHHPLRVNNAADSRSNRAGIRGSLKLLKPRRRPAKITISGKSRKHQKISFPYDTAEYHGETLPPAQKQPPPVCLLCSAHQLGKKDAKTHEFTVIPEHDRQRIIEVIYSVPTEVTNANNFVKTETSKTPPSTTTKQPQITSTIKKQTVTTKPVTLHSTTVSSTTVRQSSKPNYTTTRSPNSECSVCLTRELTRALQLRYSSSSNMSSENKSNSEPIELRMKSLCPSCDIKFIKELLTTQVPGGCEGIDDIINGQKL